MIIAAALHLNFVCLIIAAAAAALHLNFVLNTLTHVVGFSSAKLLVYLPQLFTCFML